MYMLTFRSFFACSFFASAVLRERTREGGFRERSRAKNGTAAEEHLGDRDAIWKVGIVQSLTSTLSKRRCKGYIQEMLRKTTEEERIALNADVEPRSVD